MEINVLISVLLHKGILLKTEAEALVKELTQTILPTEFNSAHRIVESILSDVEEKAKKAEAYAVSEAARLKADKPAKK